MNNQHYNQWRERAWRRKLTRAEEAQLEAWLAENPAAREDWLEENALSRMLERLPDAPLSSNFTARVLQAARRESAARERQRARGWFAWLDLHIWLPRAGVAALFLGFAGAVYHQHQVNARAVLARNVVELTQVVSSDPQLMEDFEPIRRLGDSGPKADNELLALMK